MGLFGLGKKKAVVVDPEVAKRLALEGKQLEEDLWNNNIATDSRNVEGKATVQNNTATEGVLQAIREHGMPRVA